MKSIYKPKGDNMLKAAVLIGFLVLSLFGLLVGMLNAAMFTELLMKHHKETNMTIVLVTHNESVAAYGTR